MSGKCTSTSNVKKVIKDRQGSSDVNIPAIMSLLSANCLSIGVVVLGQAGQYEHFACQFK